MQNFQLSYSDIFVVQKDFFFIYNIIKHHIKAFSNGQQVRRNFQVFDQNEGYMGYPLIKCKYFDYLKVTISQSRKTSFFTQNTIKHHIKAFLKQKQIRKNLNFLTTFICQYFDYLIVTVFYSRETSILTRTSSRPF